MRSFLLLTAFLISTTHPIFSQKQTLDEAAYGLWNQIDDSKISNNGDWIVYEINPGKGNGVLYLYHVESGEKITFPNSRKATFDAEHPFCIFETYADKTRIDSLRLLDTKDEELPSDTLVIFDLESRSIKKIPDFESMTIPTDWGGWLIAAIDEGRDTSWTEDLPRKVKEEEETGLLINLLASAVDTLRYLGNYAFAKEAPILFADQRSADSLATSRIIRWDLSRDQRQTIYKQNGISKGIASNVKGTQLGFLLHNEAEDTRLKSYQVKYWSLDDSLHTIATDSSSFLPKDWRISEHGNITFSEDGSKMFFGIAPTPLLPDTTLLPDEVAQVEVWTYSDGILYTQQKVREETERNRSYHCVYSTETNALTRLGSLQYPLVSFGDEGNALYAMASADEPYQKEKSWESTRYVDVTLLRLSDGSSVQVGQKLQYPVRFSPAADFVYWYQSADTSWYVFNINQEKTRQVTTNMISAFYDELNDQPMHPKHNGVLGWTADDKAFLVYDRFDIWSIDPLGLLAPNRLTRGRETKTVHRYIQLDPELRSIESDTILIRLTDEETREEAYAHLDLQSSALDIRLSGPYRLSRKPKKAKDTNTIMYTAESFSRFPDLLLTDLSFENSIQITNANPHQENYLWGAIEPIEWTAPNGSTLKGLLAKPADFDPSRKYPMIVNFYDRSSESLYQHRAPHPHRSTINYSFYASNGYLIFNPDVHYEVGYPGQSAYDAVVSGAQSLIDRGFVNPDRIALQGHSWGGYQIAYIITKTNLFRCAEAGAPVVNMVSAYGGIRWQTGLSRMFQYERTQSRIGATLWERPDLYLENSPIFRLDKVETPVLILHNDNDGHVPWYQGIEFFVAMRRLGKPAWLLNYNDEPHWPLKWHNRLDFNKRMFQFFEHYLKDAPTPRWMERGVPAIEKGIDQGFGLSKSSN